MEIITALFTFIGGIGMFLYGMKMMSDAMQRSAGKRMTKLLGILTGNRLLAVAVGALVTAVIQSSGATTVMVIGFVNAGVMNLVQAAGVIMGANIGTSITAWIVSLSQIGSAMKLLQPSFVAPVLIGIGAALSVFSKKQGKQTAGELVLGIGLLFMGLDLMSGAMEPYREAPLLLKAFTSMGSIPPLGMLIGFVVTVIMQSSSASIGVLQMLAANGMVGFGASVYIALGANIGSTVTALISAAGAERKARQTAVIHLLFNLFGAVLFGVIFTVLFAVRPEIGLAPVTPVGISVFHTVTKSINTVVLLPFTNTLIALSGKIVRETPEEKMRSREDVLVESMRARLDDRFLETGFTAMDIARQEVVDLGSVALANLTRSMDALLLQDDEKIDKTLRTEDAMDRMVALLSEYLLKVSNLSLTERQHKDLNDLFFAVTDIERVGDREENIAETARYMKLNAIVFSETAQAELRQMGDACADGFHYAIKALRAGGTENIERVGHDEEDVDRMEQQLRERHILRLRGGECSADAGISFMDVLANLERISDHAYNIAGYVKNEG